MVAIIIPGRSGPLVAGGTAAAIGATWNNSDKNADINLDGTKLVASATAGGPPAVCVRATSTIAANQLVYFEYTATLLGADVGCGFANSSDTLSGYPGNGTITGFCMRANSGLFQCALSANSGAALMPSVSQGDRIGVAWNSNTNLVWYRKNGGSWNPSLGGAQDPVAGTGGAATTMGSGPWYPIGFVLSGSNLDKITAAFASASWVDTVPSGFSQV